MTLCQHCKKEIIFDTSLKSEDGRLIALNPGSKTAHDCANGNEPKPQPKEESKLTNFTLRDVLLSINNEAVKIAIETYGQVYADATPDRKLMMVMHWENILTELKIKGEGTT